MDLYDNVINFYDNTKIKEITYKDFNIDKNNISLTKHDKTLNGIIICYSNLCISCKKYYNIFINLEELFNNLSFFAVNCNNIMDRNDELIKPLNITQYPIIKIIKNNKVLDRNIEINSLENLIFKINTIFK